MSEKNIPAVQIPYRKRFRLDRWMINMLGNDFGGNPGPPKDNRSMYVYDDGVYRVFSMKNDGFDVGIGYPNEWHVIMRTEAARHFAWWTIKVWATDWFGLRTYLWYIALHHSLKGKWKMHPYKHKKVVHLSNYDAWVNSHQKMQ